MMILISGATKTVERHKKHRNIGRLYTPQDGNKLRSDLPYAVDNSAYSNWDEKKFLSLLWKLKEFKRKPLWVACPDVVGNAIKTAERFNFWQPLLRELGLPVALVLQDGQERIGLPCKWSDIDAVFIGGTTEFKLGGWVRNFIPRAKEKGKWIHMGRVNSEKRMKYAKKIGCDSIDGSSFSMFPDQKIPKGLRFLEKEQMSLFTTT